MAIATNFLTNPRFLKTKTEHCPFRITPSTVNFRGYEAGSVYEIKVEFLNTERMSRRVRILPLETPQFSVDALEYENRACGVDASIAPGMRAVLRVRFWPEDLNDLTDKVCVVTEQGTFEIPVMARRHQPELELEENPIRIGHVLAGGTLARTIRVRNNGGEGAFRLAAPNSFAADGEGSRPSQSVAGGPGGGRSPPNTAHSSVSKSAPGIGGASTYLSGARTETIADIYYYDTTNPE